MAQIQKKTARREKRRLTLAVCCAVHGVQDGLGAALYVLTPILAQAFGLTYAQVGMIRAAYSCAATLFEMPSGVLAERFGERRLLVFGLVCAGAGYLLLSLATGVWTILICLLVLGTGGAFQHALSSSLISNGFHDKGRRSALGLYNSAGDVGKLAFTGLFGLATGIGMAWQGIAVIFAAIALVCALSALLVLHRVRAGNGSRPSAANQSGNAGAGGWGVDDRPGFLALCLTVSFDTAVQSGFLVFVVFVIADMGVPTHLATFAIVLTLFGGIFGKAGCGYLAERIGVRNAFVLVQCATAAGIIALLMSSSFTAFLILPFLGMVLQGSTTITYGTIADLFPGNRQSRGFAMIYTVSGLTAIAGPVVFGLLSDHAGLGAALLAMAFVSLLAIPSSLMLWTGSRQRGTV